MSRVPSSFTTEKGTELPLINLKGKPYLQVAHRLVWLTEKYDNYQINTNFLHVDEDSAIAQSVVEIYNETGVLVKRASATKKETKKDFPDFIEKAETGSLGRALAMLGLGTQFCEQDLDEGSRLADAPVYVATKAVKVVDTSEEKPTTTKSTFNKKAKPVETQETTDGWE